jgi:hypothetical protein
VLIQPFWSLSSVCALSLTLGCGDGRGESSTAQHAGVADAAWGAEDQGHDTNEANEAGRVDGHVGPATACDDIERSLAQLVLDHRSCMTDAECRRVTAFCLFEGRVHCSGAFFVNGELDDSEFAQMEAELLECRMEEAGDAGEHGCGTCLGGPLLTPICKAGICMPDPVGCAGMCNVPGDPDYAP